GRVEPAGIGPAVAGREYEKPVDRADRVNCRQIRVRIAVGYTGRRERGDIAVRVDKHLVGRGRVVAGEEALFRAVERADVGRCATRGNGPFLELAAEGGIKHPTDLDHAAKARARGRAPRSKPRLAAIDARRLGRLRQRVEVAVDDAAARLLPAQAG